MKRDLDHVLFKLNRPSPWGRGWGGGPALEGLESPSQPFPHGEGLFQFNLNRTDSNWGVDERHHHLR